jgi:predicted permease
MDYLPLLAPDFSLILCGYLLCRFTALNRTMWSQVESLVYYFLFPVLLFTTIARTNLDIQSLTHFLQAGVLMGMCGIAMAYALPYLPFLGRHIDTRMHACSTQIAFRFNSYIGLAVAFRLGGEAGTSLMALIIGFAVPLANMAAVHALAHRNQGGLLKEMAKNPLLLATISGTLFNLLGGSLPEVIVHLLTRMGSASIALGLLMVGAGLKLKGLSEARGISSYFITVKLIVLPAIALGLASWFELPPLQMQIAVMFCALPTASSAYVLAARMGGNAPLVAFLISAGTLLSIVTLPVWLLLAA